MGIATRCHVNRSAPNGDKLSQWNHCRQFGVNEPKIWGTGARDLAHRYMYPQCVYTNFIRETSSNCQVNIEEYTVTYTLLQLTHYVAFLVCLGYM